MYRAPEPPQVQPSALPSVAELAATRGTSLTATAGALSRLFESISAACVEDLTRSISIWESVLFGAAVSSAIAFVVGVARVAKVPEGSPLLVIAFIVGTLYGVGRVVTWKIRWVDKKSGQNITGVMPLVVGFGYGLAAFAIEALLSLVPVPTVVTTLLVTAGLGALWKARYRARFPGLQERIPFIGVSHGLFRMADANATASVTWADPAAPRTTPESYRASAHMTDGRRVTCVGYTYPASAALEVVVEFPAGFVWRHGTERVTLDGLTLEVARAPTGSIVRTTNTHAPVTAKLFAQALSVSLAACGRA